MSTDRIAKAIEALGIARDDYFCNSVLKGGRKTSQGELLEDRGIKMEEALEALRQPSPTMMPDADTKWAMTKVMREEFIRQYQDNERAKAPSIAMYEDETSPYLMLESALSCDAFRNWLGGVGERTLPELDKLLESLWVIHLRDYALAPDAQIVTAEAEELGKFQIDNATQELTIPRIVREVIRWVYGRHIPTITYTHDRDALANIKTEG